jgi:hypothetical protein
MQRLMNIPRLALMLADGATCSRIQPVVFSSLYDAVSISGGRRFFSTDPSNQPEEREITNPRVLTLAEQIMQLNLLEVSDLTEILKKRLNIQTPAFGGMPFGMPMAAAGVPAAAAPAGESEKRG